MKIAVPGELTSAYLALPVEAGVYSVAAPT